MALKQQHTIYLLALIFLASTATAQLFTDVTSQVGLDYAHINNPQRQSELTFIGGGGAVADYDFDGFPDFYLLGGTNQANALFKNQGNGTFVNVAAAAQVDLFDVLSSGPVFFDVDGDFDLDLLVFSINREGQSPQQGNTTENRPRLFINQGQGTFTESLVSGFSSGMPSVMGTPADFDKDGDLDIFMTHWNNDYETSKQLFWVNDGTGTFSDQTIEYLGIPQNANFDRWTFTPNITDINEDGWLDVLLTGDFGTTRILYSNSTVNNQLTFSTTQPPVITDENGMGAALADYDNDGDLDWFVTSIYDPDGQAEGNWGTSGNRLYRNTGMGVFEDATDEAGLRHGFWGWGACFADFNNDGHMDIYHENGFTTPVLATEFHHDPARLFMANGDGTFTESAATNGLNHTDQGRGVSCVDYDLDGRVDILVMPNNAPYKLYRNIASNNNHFLGIRLFDSGTNPYAIQAKIAVTTAASTQTKELAHANNYASNNPLTQHFGLGQESNIQSIQVTWPDGHEQVINQHLVSDQTISIGRHCHTSYYNVGYTDLGAGKTVTLYLHADDGMPIDNQAVTLSITQGPLTGHNQTLNTNAQGVVQFPLQSTQTGTDRLRFEFTIGGSPNHVCRALVNWRQDVIYANGLELN